MLKRFCLRGLIGSPKSVIDFRFQLRDLYEIPLDERALEPLVHPLLLLAIDLDLCLGLVTASLGNGASDIFPQAAVGLFDDGRLPSFLVDAGKEGLFVGDAGHLPGVLEGYRVALAPRSIIRRDRAEFELSDIARRHPVGHPDPALLTREKRPRTEGDATVVSLQRIAGDLDDFDARSRRQGDGKSAGDGVARGGELFCENLGEPTRLARRSNSFPCLRRRAYS